MKDYELGNLKFKTYILKEVMKEFGSNRSLGNVVQNMEARIKGEEKRREK